MRHAIAAAIIACVAAPAIAADEPINLRGMGSFHIGGRVATVSGKETRMIQRQPGGPTSEARSERRIHGRADVCAIFSATESQG